MGLKIWCRNSVGASSYNRLHGQTWRNFVTQSYLYTTGAHLKCFFIVEKCLMWLCMLKCIKLVSLTKKYKINISFNNKCFWNGSVHNEEQPIRVRPQNVATMIKRRFCKHFRQNVTTLSFYSVTIYFLWPWYSTICVSLINHFSLSLLY